jgi:hypothetical protein
MIETGDRNFREGENIQKSDEGMTVGRNETEMGGKDQSLLCVCFFLIIRLMEGETGTMVVFFLLNFRQSTSQLKWNRSQHAHYNEKRANDNTPNRFF